MYSLYDRWTPTIWSQVRSQGRRHFIIHYGIRRFAVPLGAFVWFTMFLVVPLFFQGDAPNWAYLGSRPFWLALLSSLILWPVGGFIWGAWEWRRREAQYRDTSR